MSGSGPNTEAAGHPVEDGRPALPELLRTPGGMALALPDVTGGGATFLAGRGVVVLVARGALDERLTLVWDADMVAEYLSDLQELVNEAQRRRRT